jgi:NAD(P)H dehydrogenase (quinone)
MRVLTVYAHPDPKSFTHAVLEEFTRGLRDSGHEPDVLDLYALKFDPVFTSADMATWLDPGMPPDGLDRMNPRQKVLDGATGPVQRFAARRAMRGKDNQAIARMIPSASSSTAPLSLTRRRFRGYLERFYELGKEFDTTAPASRGATSA